MNSRRDFLQKLGVSALALHLAPVSAWADRKDNNNEAYDGPVLRVAIMGLGSYGTRVAAMQSCIKAKLVGVVSGTPSKLKTGKASIPYRRRIVTIMRISAI
ncbi:MAG: gfo 1 [Mucilaginibacter sp.]|nr:gfo 1 [Mucilaginibacter sp.]